MSRNISWNGFNSRSNSLLQRSLTTQRLISIVPIFGSVSRSFVEVKQAVYRLVNYQPANGLLCSADAKCRNLRWAGSSFWQVSGLYMHATLWRTGKSFSSMLKSQIMLTATMLKNERTLSANL